MSDRFMGKYRGISLRLKGWDYSSSAAYFITVNTAQKQSYFGNVRDGKVVYSEIGIITCKCWKAIPEHFPFVSLGEWIVMPNHVHGILFINKVEGSAKPVGPTKDISILQNGAGDPGSADHDAVGRQNIEGTGRNVVGTQDIEGANRNVVGTQDIASPQHYDISSSKNHGIASLQHYDISSSKNHGIASPQHYDISSSKNHGIPSPQHPDISSQQPPDIPSAQHHDNAIPQFSNEFAGQSSGNVMNVSQGNIFGPQSQNLSSVIRGFKVGVKKYATIHRIEFKWQSRYYDRIIRDENEFYAIRQYIKNNPARWNEDLS